MGAKPSVAQIARAGNHVSGLTVDVYAAGATSAFSSGTTDSEGNYALAVPSGPYSLMLHGSGTYSAPLDGNWLWRDSGGHTAQSPTCKGGYSTPALGLTAALSRPQTLPVNYTRDAIGRVTNVTRYVEPGSSVVIARTTYTYDVAGELLAVQTTNGTGSALALHRYAFGDRTFR